MKARVAIRPRSFAATNAISSARNWPNAMRGTSAWATAAHVVEPNVKDGKGGLRDLHTLYWIGKFIHRVQDRFGTGRCRVVHTGRIPQLPPREGFLLAVRSRMHVLTGRAEDRLTFDLQRRIAERMNFAERPGKSAVERFMQYYFLQAKRVGSLTGVFLAHIDEQFEAKTARRGFFAGWGRSRAS